MRLAQSPGPSPASSSAASVPRMKAARHCRSQRSPLARSNPARVDAEIRIDAAAVAAGDTSPATLALALSGKVESVGWPAKEGVLKEGSAAHQAMVGVPVSARQAAKRSARRWR